MADSKSKEYRVVSVGLSYTAPERVTNPDGSEGTVHARKDAHAGDTITLTAAESERLVALGAVVPADADKTYGEMTVKELQAEADERGLTVEGSGANGNVLQEDLLTALKADDEAKA